MAEEFKSHQNTKADQELRDAVPEDGISSGEDLRVTGVRKSYKKKRGRAVYPLLIILLLGVMGFSGFQIAATLLRNLKAQNVYDEIENEFVSYDEPTVPVPAQTVPRETKEGPRIDETEEQVPIMTVEADPETEPLDPMRILSVDFASLKQANRDAVAWLQGMGGNISYPVVQGRDNEYYLKHLFNGSVNPNGTLFVHCENRFLQDDITFIFGHHMKSGKMFGHLTDYDSSDYYWNNQEFRLYTPEKIYTLKIYAVVYGTGTEQITLNYANEADFNRGMKEYAARAVHPATVPVSYGDKMVCLCTCSHRGEDGRCFVYCKVMP